MIPEIAVLLQRAASRRTVLEGLLDSIPRGYWNRQAPGDAWSAGDHLRHLATIDELVLPVVRQASTGTADGGIWLGGPDPGDLDRQRAATMGSAAEASPDELRARMRASREAVAHAISDLPERALDRRIRLALVDDGWSSAGEWSVRAYLRGWSEHDAIHEEGIRRAIATPPDLAAVVLMRRRA